MISLEVDFVNIYYNIFNNTAIIYIATLNCKYTIHRPIRPTTLTTSIIQFSKSVNQCSNPNFQKILFQYLALTSPTIRSHPLLSVCSFLVVLVCKSFESGWPCTPLTVCPGLFTTGKLEHDQHSHTPAARGQPPNKRMRRTTIQLQSFMRSDCN